MNHTYYVYIITNYSKSVLYTGRTNNLEQRLVEHYSNRGLPKTFAGRYHCILSSFSTSMMLFIEKRK